jgi:glycosyltransferase involved in cell wall biosynthesis
MRILLLPKGENDYMDIKDGNPLFTIIVAVLNSKESLERCIESVNNQTYPYKELIIIDGGSIDGTVEIIKNNHDNIVYWESKPDRGIYHAFNKALKYAQGEWIYFLGSDDYLWTSDVLDKVAQNIRGIRNSVRLVYGEINHLRPDNRIIKTSGAEWDGNKIDFSRMPIDHQALFHHSTIFEDYGLYDEKYKIISDYEFQMRVFTQHGETGRFIPVTIAGHRYGGISTYRRNRLKILREAELIRDAYGIKVPLPKKIYKHMGALFWVLLSYVMGEKTTQKIEDELLFRMGQFAKQ